MHLRHFEAIAEATNRADLHKALHEVTNALDFGKFTLLWWAQRKGKLQGAYVHNTPAAFLDQAKDPDVAMADPVYRHILSSPRPVVYDQSTYVASGAASLWESQAPFGYKAGIALAMNANGGRLCFGFDRDSKTPEEPAKLAYLVAQVSMIVSYAQDTHHLVLNEGDGGGFREDVEEMVLTGRRTNTLSLQRIRILRLIAEGKSTGVIAQLMGVTDNTVKYHVRQIFSTLGVATRAQAIVKGAQYLSV